jgi:cell division septal protein FtsQ
MSVRLSSAPRGSDRLAARRRTRRRRAVIALSILFVLLCAGLVYGLQQSPVRISNIVVYGAETFPTSRQESFLAIASSTIQGEYFGLIPRDSIFFFPGSRIRADIISAHPGIAAVSIFRNGLTGISIKLNERVPIARWCGLAPTPGVDEYCYVFDANGFVFAAAATSTETVNSFALYAPLVGDTEEPLRATISRADQLPAVFDFARELAIFGSPVVRVVIRNDEVDDYLKSGTRVTFVLGNEENAFTALVSARDNLNLVDGSLDYVDLRFDRKMYIKRK